jgi:membrane peptidoglycan carboxypeptidase
MLYRGLPFACPGEPETDPIRGGAAALWNALTESAAAGCALDEIILPRTARTARLSAAGVVRGSRYRAGLATFLASLVLLAIATEVRSSRLQALLFSRIGRHLHYAAGPGPSPAIRIPAEGPYDVRLGYARLPTYLAVLEDRGYSVAAQNRFSPLLLRLTDWGLSPPYPEKTRTGLRVEDRRGRWLFVSLRPDRVFEDFASIPPLVVETLLFIENRELLDPREHHRNPAIEWDRLARAAGAQLSSFGGVSSRPPGGSTLATQMEKYRHSPGGQTTSVREKLRQIVSASLRAYRDGADTSAARRRILLDYLNTVPLSGASGRGEVFGLGDGLRAWYGADLSTVSALLTSQKADRARRGRAFRQVLSLLLSQRRPSYYLLHDRAALDRLTNRYLSLLFESGIIDAELRSHALAVELDSRGFIEPPSREGFVKRKGTDAIRAELLELLGVPRFYDLDRLDLKVRTTLDAEVQASVTDTLLALGDPREAETAGLRAPRLLAGSDPGEIVYSFTLLERVGAANALRIQADTLDQPFNLNRGMKLDLGSTAKLRTLIHYLELVADLRERYRDRSRQALDEISLHPSDPISRFVVDRLRANPELALSELLDAALERRYSARPANGFFTGGGIHRFRNYRRLHDAKQLTVREAFRHSVNLPFVRLLRDIVNHLVYGPEGPGGDLLENPDDPRRVVYLTRFAELESEIFLDRFAEMHRALTPAQRLEAVAAKARPRADALAVVFRAARPAASPTEFAAFLEQRLPAQQRSRDQVVRLYQAPLRDSSRLADRAFVAGVHPLELWLVSYLEMAPDASRTEILEASGRARSEAYRWLFRTRRKHAQDSRIRTVLERDAFVEIHRAWARVGYPFPELVPSLATAIGASADRPESLAELLGILVSDGLRLPTRRIKELRFAEATPYETVVRPIPGTAERVLSPEVAEAAKRELFDVVETGTARRIRGGIARSDGTPLRVGGKTGTGDNRSKVFGPRGQLLASRVTSRTATFAFLIGNRFFGVITAHVMGERAAEYEFTSSLAVQVLKVLGPSLAAEFASEPQAEDALQIRGVASSETNRSRDDASQLETSPRLGRAAMLAHPDPPWGNRPLSGLGLPAASRP